MLPNTWAILGCTWRSPLSRVSQTHNSHWKGCYSMQMQADTEIVVTVQAIIVMDGMYYIHERLLLVMAVHLGSVQSEQNTTLQHVRFLAYVLNLLQIQHLLNHHVLITNHHQSIKCHNPQPDASLMILAICTDAKHVWSEPYLIHRIIDQTPK